MAAPTVLDVAVPGGALHVSRWGTGPRTVLGIHGLTASSLALAPVARHVGSDATLIAPDLRGRGRSAELPGPYGLRRHAADCAAVIESLGDEPVAVVGESSGAFAAVMLATSRPDLVSRLVLVDGGLPLDPAPGMSREQVLRAELGPVLARLRLKFPTRRAYLDFWHAHPAFFDLWNNDVEAYLSYDLTGVEPRLVSRVAEAAVQEDVADTVGEGVRAALAALADLTMPVHLLRAARNPQNVLPPLIGDELVERWRRVVPRLVDEVVPDTNHFSILFGERGARAIAARAVTSDSRGGGFRSTRVRR